MIERTLSQVGNVRVEVVEYTPTRATYRVIRAMPAWYRLLGGEAQTQYDETFTIENGKMVTSAKQNLPFGGSAETKIVFVGDGKGETLVFGTVSASNLPTTAQTVVKRVFRGFVKKTFKEERAAENSLLLNLEPATGNLIGNLNVLGGRAPHKNIGPVSKKLNRV